MNSRCFWIPLLILMVASGCRNQDDKSVKQGERSPDRKSTQDPEAHIVQALNLCDSLVQPSDPEDAASDFGEAREVFYRFPTPDEMLSFIDHKNYRFDGELLSSTQTSGQYLDSRTQAINLGIYIGDLAYITLFQRNNEALSYFRVIHELSMKLRISSAFDPGMLKRFENNFNNLDSLKALIDESITDIMNYLEKENKNKDLAIISIGGFIEALYLAFNMVDSFSEDNVIVQRISDQKLVLENIIGYACLNSDDAGVVNALSFLVPIWQIYNRIALPANQTQVSRGADGKLIISSGGAGKARISKNQYEALKETVFIARERITQNK